MPNWCNNCFSITVKDKKILEKIVAIVKNDSLSVPLEVYDDEENRWAGMLNYFCPIPEEEKDNWYGWCSDNWGTKWDLDLSDTMIDSDDIEEINCDCGGVSWCLEFSFLSAWAPPNKAFTKFIEKNEGSVSIINYYYENGNCFAGKFVDGVNEYYEYDEWDRNDPRWEQDDIIMDLDEMFSIKEDLEDYWQEQENEEKQKPVILLNGVPLKEEDETIDFEEEETIDIEFDDPDNLIKNGDITQEEAISLAIEYIQKHPDQYDDMKKITIKIKDLVAFKNEK